MIFLMGKEILVSLTSKLFFEDMLLQETTAMGSANRKIIEAAATYW